MTDFPVLTLSECVDTLLKLKRPLVVMHVRPDGDTVGSGTALCEIFRALGVEAKYICADKIPARLSFLTEGIECATSTEGYELVSIDVASPAQMGSLFKENTIHLTIDHHEVNTPYAPNYTVGGLSSAGEVLYRVAAELEKRGLITINTAIAERLYAAISSDTGGFIFSTATPDTYGIAARLICCGINHSAINHKLFMSKPMEQIRAEGLVASGLRSAANGRISYAVVTRRERENLGIPLEHFECGIDVVRSVAGTEIAFIIKESDNGEIKASLRSTGQNIAQIAARHGGGGHLRAAGCSIDAATPLEAAEKLAEELTEAFFS